MQRRKMKKRKLDILVLSDVHLGTYGCHAEELCDYLDSIDPKKIILNGDIIDVWNFKKSYWPAAHTEVLRRLMKFLSKGVEIFYITGNHDEVMRKFTVFHLSNLHIVDKLVLNLEGEKAWIFHGDVFDVSMKYSKWLAKFGGAGYDLLIVLNRFTNTLLNAFGYEKFSLSKKIKDGVKKAVKYVHDYEQTAAELAIENGFDYVVLGHIHNPEQRTIIQGNKKVVYLNSGDWIENLTSLEYRVGQWTLYKHPLTNRENVFTHKEAVEHQEISLKALLA